MKWVTLFFVLCLYVWGIFILNRVNLRYSILMEKLRRGENGRKKKEREEKGKKEVKFCLKGKFPTWTFFFFLILNCRLSYLSSGKILSYLIALVHPLVFKPWLVDGKTGMVVNTYMPRKQIWFSVFLSAQQTHLARELYLSFQTCFLPLCFPPPRHCSEKGTWFAWLTCLELI